jgi:phage anti-repressor protein
MMNELVELKERFEGIAQSSEKFPVDFDPAWQWVGYSTKQKGLNMLTTNFEKDMDFLTVRLKSTGGRPAEGYFLTVDCFKSFCMMAGTQKGKEVRKYYLEIEREYRRLLAEKKPEPYVCCYSFFNDPRNLRALDRLSRLVDSGKMSRLEFRKIMFGPDAQDIEPDPMVRAKDLRLAVAKGLATKEEYRTAMGLPAEMPKTAKPDVTGSFIKFASEYIEFTGNKEDFVTTHDIYERYKAVTEAPISLWSFTYSLKGNFPGVSHKQKKIKGYPTLCFFGIRYKDTVEAEGNG